jgi:hypothetical protein
VTGNKKKRLSELSYRWFVRERNNDVTPELNQHFVRKNKRDVGGTISFVLYLRKYAKAQDYYPAIFLNRIWTIWDNKRRIFTILIPMPMEHHLFAIVVLLKNEVASESWKDHYPWYIYENSSEIFSCPVYSSEIFCVDGKKSSPWEWIAGNYSCLPYFFCVP